MGKFWFELADITLEEETETLHSDTDAHIIAVNSNWTASIDTRLRTGSSFESGAMYKGSHVRMSRKGATANDAIVELEREIIKQGWELKQ